MDDVFSRRIESQRSRAAVLMRGLRASALVLAFVLVLTPGAANAASTLDQQQTEHNICVGVVAGGSPESLAQTYTAGLSGTLDHVELVLAKNGPPLDPALPLKVEIRNVEAGGAPGAIVLASETVPASSVPAPSALAAFVSVTFAVPTQVEAGKQYAIVAYTADTHIYWWCGKAGNPYAAGEAWASKASPPTTWTSIGRSEIDLAFKTYVTPAAKPTTVKTRLSGEGKSGEHITVKEGEAVTDQATLSGENAAKAGGTVTYKVYTDSQCSNLVKEAGTVKVSNGAVPASEPETLTGGISYFWQAEYSGDETNAPTKSECTEIELVLATCGKTTVGKLSDQLVANQKRVNACKLPYTAAIKELVTYLAPTTRVGTQVIKGVIYADNKGKPGVLLGATSPITFSSKEPAGWYHLAFLSGLLVPQGNCWIGIITGATSQVAGERYDSVRNAEDYNANNYTTGPSNPFGSFKTTNEQMSLYAAFTRQPA